MNPTFIASVLVLCAISLLFPRRGRALRRLTHPEDTQSSRLQEPSANEIPEGVPDLERSYGQTGLHDPTPSHDPTRSASSGSGRRQRSHDLTRPLAFVPSRQLTRPGILPRSARLALIRIWPLGPAAMVLAVVFGPQILVSAAAIGVIAVLIAIQRAQHQRRSSAAARRTQIIEALDVLAADLTAGRPPIDALEGAASISPDLRIAHAEAKLGGDVPVALDLASESPGAGGLRALAAAWRVSEESGAAFAALTERLSDSLRADETIHRQTEASLAGARSTARILAALPVFGIALGYSLGAKPLTFLTATPAGWLCLTAGLALTAAGLHWTTRLSEPPT